MFAFIQKYVTNREKLIKDILSQYEDLNAKLVPNFVFGH